MGYNIYNYLGAYIELPEAEQEKLTVFYRCNNVNCFNHNKKMESTDIFCNQCGAKVEKATESKKTMGNLSCSNFAEDNGLDPDQFIQVQNNILIPNHNTKNAYRWSDDDSDFLCAIDTKDYQKSIEEFTEFAKNFVDKVKEVYGVELTVKYGIVSYAQ